MTKATITTPEIAEGWYCEGPCSNRSSDSSPVYKIEIDYTTYWRCANCLVDAFGQSVECRNCGESGATYCSTECAASYSGDECGNCGNGSCANCGNDDARYCDASCAIADGSENYCTECSGTVEQPDRCNEHREPTGNPLAIAAASNVAKPEGTDDAGNVVVDGTSFTFS